MRCRGLAPGFGYGAAKNTGGDSDDLEYDPVGLEEGGLAGRKWRRRGRGGRRGVRRPATGVWRERERGGGSYHRPVFGGGEGFVDRLSSGGLVL